MYSPRALHFGDIRKTAVKRLKYHLFRAIRNTHLIYKEFNTLLVQIEAILNSQPNDNSNPNDNLPLTPSHFLIRKPLNAVLDPDLKDISLSKHSRLQLLYCMYQELWRAWSREYISTLQR